MNRDERPRFLSGYAELMDADNGITVPPLPENLAEIHRELTEHARSASVMTPAKSVGASVFFAFFALLSLAMMLVPAWAIQTAQEKKQLIPARDAGTALVVCLIGMMLSVMILPAFVRVPRWLIRDSPFPNILGLVGGLPTLVYLGCAYHAVRVAMKAHDAPGAINTWRRRWVADYLHCPIIVRIIGRATSSGDQLASQPPDDPEKRTYFFGFAARLDKSDGLNRLADTWRCVEAVGRVYAKDPTTFASVLPVLQQWLQIVYTFRKLETTPHAAHLDQFISRCDFISARGRQLIEDTAAVGAASKSIRPIEIWLASGITIAVGAALVTCTLRFGAEKCVASYIAALLGLFTIWWNLFQAYQGRKKVAEARVEPSKPVSELALQQVGTKT